MNYTGSSRGRASSECSFGGNKEPQCRDQKLEEEETGLVPFDSSKLLSWHSHLV